MSAMTWRMCAQRRGSSFHHFGPHDWAARHAGDGVAEVELEEDPDGGYLAWMDDGGDVPLCISTSYAALSHTFRAGDPDVGEPRFEQQRGRGRVVRLRVRRLEPVGAR
jgi:hypothetical protein